MVDFAIFSFHVTETFHVANNRHLLSYYVDLLITPKLVVVTFVFSC